MRIWDSSSLRQPEEMAIFQQRPLLPAVQLGKAEADRQKNGGVHLVLTIACSRRYSTWVFCSNNASLVRHSKMKLKVY